MPNILIINLGIGNVNSVAAAFKNLNTTVKLTENSDELIKCDAIVLPGVGSFKHAMEFLNKESYIKKLNQLVIKDKIPFLGICLGMQLLADEGEEWGTTKGLGWIPGRVVKLNESKNFRVPHIGWDDIQVKKESPLFLGLPAESSFYFVHSYYLDADNSIVNAYCDYGKKISVGVQKENIFGVQFHPEKSQKNGIQLLKNFLEHIKKDGD